MKFMGRRPTKCPFVEGSVCDTTCKVNPVADILRRIIDIATGKDRRLRKRFVEDLRDKEPQRFGECEQVQKRRF